MPPIRTEVERQVKAASGSRFSNLDTIINGREAKLAHAVAEFQGGSFARRNPGAAMLAHGGATLSLNELSAFLAIVDAGPPNHRNIIGNPQWRAFYHAVPMTWEARDHAGNLVARIPEIGIACWKCRIVLPLRGIQVDHSRPQSGVITEAVAKVFRHAGLTVGAPRGEKGRASSGRIADGATVQQRYTLTAKGTLVFHTIKNCAGGVMTSFRDSCLNSYANLRPLCGRCNAGRNALPTNRF